MHVAAFIGKLQHYKNFKPSYLSTGKWAISPFLSDQVTYTLPVECSIRRASPWVVVGATGGQGYTLNTMNWEGVRVK